MVCHEVGPPSGLVVEETPDPVPGVGQVVLDVAAAGVNYVDALFVAGRYQIKPSLPFVPGSEIAGVVSALGPGAAEAGVAIGDRMLASVGLGGFAERAAVAADGLAPIPAVLDFAQAATFGQSYCTALYALRDRAGLQPGETVLVLGAGGGVGLAAIDVAQVLGGVPIAAASTVAKREAALEAGAVAAIDSTSASLKERARQLAGGTGIDVVLDPVGGDLAEPALRALGNGGRYLVVGFASGTIPALPLNQVLLRNRQVVGVDWGAWAMTNADEQRDLLDELLRAAGAGDLHPVSPATYPLPQVGDAIQSLLDRRVVGKVALLP